MRSQIQIRLIESDKDYVYATCYILRGTLRVDQVLSRSDGPKVLSIGSASINTNKEQVSDQLYPHEVVLSKNEGGVVLIEGGVYSTYNIDDIPMNSRLKKVFSH